MSEQAYENCYGVINNHIIGKSTVDNRNLALVYDPDSVYNKGNHCIHEMKYWVCNTNNTTGPWDATKWDQTRVGDETSIEDVTSELTFPTSGILRESGYVYKVGNTIYIELVVIIPNGTTNGAMLFTLSDKIIPKFGSASPIYDWGTGKMIITGGCVNIYRNGNVQYYGPTVSVSNYLRAFICCSYVV